MDQIPQNLHIVVKFGRLQLSISLSLIYLLCENAPKLLLIDLDASIILYLLD